MVDLIPERPKKGRGAVSNASGRYEPFTRVAIDDGWGEAGTAVGGDGFGEPPAPPTEVTWDATRSIITRNNSPDIGFDRRSEEHTSELQSLMRISYAVFCLQKTISDTNNHTSNILTYHISTP